MFYTHLLSSLVTHTVSPGGAVAATEISDKHFPAYSVKRSDVAGNPFEWLLGKKMLYKSSPILHHIRLPSELQLQVKAIEFHIIL